jgi:hypothetical protein
MPTCRGSWPSCAGRNNLSSRALEFTILTAARTSDTVGAIPAEVDRQERAWIVPAARLKGRRGRRKRDHYVPLSDRALPNSIKPGRNGG